MGTHVRTTAVDAAPAPRRRTSHGPSAEPIPARNGRGVALAALLLLVLLAVAGVVVPVAADCGVYENGEPKANCAICPRKGLHSQINDLSGVPRVDMKAKSVSRDLGEFDFYTCEWGPGNNCDFNTDIDLADVIGQNPPPRGVAHYVQGFVPHAIFAVACALLTLVIGIGFGLGRYCCCCCGKARCVGGCCGARFPTQKPPASASRCRRICNCGGMEPTPAGLAGEPDAQRWAYTRRDKLVALFSFLSFVFCVLLFVGLAFFSGVRAMPNALNKVVDDSPASVLDAVSGTRRPLGDFLMSLASESVVSAFRDINATFNEVVPVKDVLAQADCVLISVSSLPSTQGILDFIADAKQRLTNLVSHVAVIQTDLADGLDASKDKLTANITTLLVTPLQAVEDGIKDTLNKTDEISVELTSLQSDIDQLTDATVGIPGVRDDLAVILTMPTPDVVMQTTSATATSTPPIDSGDHASLIILWDDSKSWASQTDLSGQGAAATNSRNDLTTKLAGFVADFASFSDFAVTAARLRAINTILGGFQGGGTDRLLASIDETSATVLKLGDLVANLSAAATNFQSQLPNLVDLSPGYSALDNLNASLYDPALRPDFNALRAEVDTLIAPLTDSILPCLSKLFDYVKAINATLVQLPEDMNVAEEVLTLINSTAADARSSVDDAIAELDTFETERDKINITAFREKLDEVRRTILTENGVTDSSVLGDLDAVVNQTRALNFTSLLEDIRSFRDVLALTPIDDQLPYALELEALETTLDDIRTDLTAVSADVAQWNKGVCVSDYTTQCTSATAIPVCGGLACVYEGSRRCRLNPTIECPGPGYPTDPNPDTPCVAPGDSCLVQPVAITRLISRMDAWALAKPERDVNATTMGLKLQGLFLAADEVDTQGAFDDLTAATDTMRNTNTSSFYELLADATNQFDQFDLSDLKDQVTQLNDTINSIDYSIVDDQVSRLNDSLREVQEEKMQPLRDSRDVIFTFEQLLNVKFVEYEARLSPANLAAVRASEGVSGLLAHVADVADDATSFLTASQDLLTLTSDLRNSTEDIRERIDILLAEGPRGRLVEQQGSLYQLVELGVLGNKDDYLRVDDPDWHMRDEYEKDVNGASYADDRKCVTQECIKNTIERLLGSSSGGGESLDSATDGKVPIPLSREQLMALPLILPVLVVLVASIAFALYKVSTWWSSCLSSFALCLTFPFAALLFLLSAVLFPVLLVYSDVCLGMENVSMQYVRAQGDNICTDRFSGTGTAQACVIDAFDDTSVVLDVPQVFLSVLAGRCDGADDALAPVWDSLRTSLMAYPEREVDKYLDEQEAKAGEGDLVVRPRLKQPLHLLAQRTAAQLDAFVRDVATTSLSCKALSSMWEDVKAPLCCDVGTTLYWSAGGIYLLAFSLIICGVPSMLKARKRLPAKPWGPYATDDDEAYKGFVHLGLSAVPGVELQKGDQIMVAQLPPEEPHFEGVADPAGAGTFAGVAYGPAGSLSGEEQVPPVAINPYMGGSEGSPLVGGGLGSSSSPHALPYAGGASGSGELSMRGVEMQPIGSRQVADHPGAYGQHVSIEVGASTQVDAEPLPLSPSAPLASPLASPSRAQQE